jgi:hypothetical protein
MTELNLPFDPAIPLLGIYPKDCDTGYSRGICTPMFIAALFTIAKLWKQPRCPTTDKWIKKMLYLYTMEFYAAMKKNEMLSFAGKWMELEIRSRANTTRGLNFDHKIKVRAQKGDMRIGKASKKLASICYPQCRETKADTLKATEANRRRGPGSREKVRSKRINLEGMCVNTCTGN